MLGVNLHSNVKSTQTLLAFLSNFLKQARLHDLFPATMEYNIKASSKELFAIAAFQQLPFVPPGMAADNWKFVHWHHLLDFIQSPLNWPFILSKAGSFREVEQVQSHACVYTFVLKKVRFQRNGLMIQMLSCLITGQAWHSLLRISKRKLLSFLKEGIVSFSLVFFFYNKLDICHLLNNNTEHHPTIQAGSLASSSVYQSGPWLIAYISV